VRVALLTSNLSTNCLGRAYLLQRVLARSHETWITGPAPAGLWEPLCRADVRVAPYKYRDPAQVLLHLPTIVRSIQADLIYAHKPKICSLDVGLAKKMLSGKPLFLDIDDWELGFFHAEHAGASLSRKARVILGHIKRADGYWWLRANEFLSRFADEITVSNKFLQERFGGVVLPHGRDTQAWDPMRFDRDEIRRSLGVGDRQVVLFLGTPRPQKGIEDLVNAMARVRGPDTLLMLVGIDDEAYSQRVGQLALRRLGPERVRLIGRQPFERVPEFMVAADVVVVPQRRSAGAVGQMPAKVYDAMAMARPIVATRVSDLPETLEGCGWIVEPGQPDQLAEAIQDVLDHPAQAARAGAAARRKCEREYSFDAMHRTLAQLVARYT
jgi:glycosyltransferase involved in cell wall biosynthesis